MIVSLIAFLSTLRYVDVRGADYESHIKTALISLHTQSHTATDYVLGAPLPYNIFNHAIDENAGAASSAPLVIPRDSYYASWSMYYYFGDMVKAGLAKVLDTMTPEDFGYHKLHREKIGPDLATRKQLIEQLEARLNELRGRKATLTARLYQIKS